MNTDPIGNMRLNVREVNVFENIVGLHQSDHDWTRVTVILNPNENLAGWYLSVRTKL